MSINASNNPYPDSPDASPTKLDKGGYDGTAETLDNKIDEILAEAKILINNTLVGSASLGSIVPSSVPPATGAVHAFATQAGTYTNWGGFVIPANTFALISRSSNLVFSISQTALDVSGKVNVSDVINTLVSSETAKPLSAAQGKVLKDLVDTKVNTTVTDNLTSTSATNALSANQGRVLDLKIAQGIVNWTAKAFLINDEVSHLGKLWQANAAIISTDVPGTSSKWVEILSGYGLKSDLEVVKNKTSEISETSEDFKYSYAIADHLGNVAFGIDYQGNIYFNEALSSFISKLSNIGFVHELESGIYKISKLKTTGDGGEVYLLDELNNIALFCSEKGIFKLKIDPIYFLSNARSAGLFKSNYDQKNLLAIGDSLTAVLIWQIKAAELLGATATTHALGGIDFIGMVDGSGSLPALSTSTVTGKDIIVLFGGYNERTQPLGVVGDLYPTQNTVAGRLQYAINKIYEKLTAANNLTCRVVVATPHCSGANGYVYVDGYTKWNNNSLKEIAEIMVSVSNYNNVPCYNSWQNSGIGKFNWNIFQSSATPNNSTYTYKGDFTSIGAVNFTPVTNDCVTVNFYTGYLYTGGAWVIQTTPKFPWKNDQLHLNTLGYEYIGKKFAQYINTI